MLSFAWGLAPSSARLGQPELAKAGGCTVSDEAWEAGVSETVDPARGAEVVAARLSCTMKADPALVPRLLIRELLVTVAEKLLSHNDTILTTPRVTVHSCTTTRDYPPSLWLVTFTACFPCDGTPVTRCARMTAILDARHVAGSRVVSALDAGVVPAEQSVSGGVLPVNAQSAEMA